VLLGSVIALATGVLVDIPIYVMSTRIYERRGETLRRSVVLLGHGLLVLALALCVGAVIDLEHRHFDGDAPFSSGAAVALLILGPVLGALANIIIQRERQKAR
jgi:hypothetical protein